MSIVPGNIRNTAPNCSLSLFFCENTTCSASFTTCTTAVTTEPEFDWSVKLQCTTCNKVWWLCKVCNLRKKISRRAFLLRHQYANHKASQSVAKPKKKRHRDVDYNPFEHITEENYNENEVNDILQNVVNVNINTISTRVDIETNDINTNGINTISEATESQAKRFNNVAETNNDSVTNTNITSENRGGD